MRARGAVGAAVAAGFLLAGAAGAAELRVAPAGPYRSIGAAVEAARPGDTVRVAAGLYRERVVIDRPLALLGEPGAVVDGGGEGTVVHVAAPDVRLEGLVLRASGRSLDRDDSAVLVTGPRAVVRGNVLEEVLHGVYLRGAGGATVARNVIRGGEARSLSTRGDGVRIWNASGNVVADNDIRDVRDGIYVQAADDNAIERNAVRGSRYGLHYMYAGRNAFVGNRFEENQVGASVMMSRGITLEANTFARNAGYVGYGLLLQDAKDVVVEGNRFVGNATGIFMDLAIGGRVVGNLVTGHEVGIHLYPSSEDNVVAGNLFASNVADVHTGRGGAANRFADDRGGNYWSGAAVYDFDGDGFGDAPHRTGSLVTHLAEAYPQMRLFLFSPAVRALDLAERAVPVFRVPEAVDPRPLVRPPLVAAEAPIPAREAAGGRGLAAVGALMLAVGGGGLAVGVRRRGRRR
ncbi:MAG TPA: nitrous oxide reductase family maturation protein NosD [Thermodesulfobacteriota bacterium]